MTADPVAIDTGLSVAGLLVARAGDDHPGLRFEDEQWSWREVVSASAVRASWIRSVSGPEPLHVGVLLGNVPEYIFWLGAAALAGAVVVGINPTRRGEALAGDIGRTDCQVLVTDADGARLLDGLELPGRRPVIRVDDAGYADRLAPHAGADARSLVAACPPPRVPSTSCCSPREPPVPPRPSAAPRARLAVDRGPVGRGLRLRAATTWPTAPCPCSTATR